jgi:hypothetical protein
MADGFQAGAFQANAFQTSQPVSAQGQAIVNMQAPGIFHASLAAVSTSSVKAQALEKTFQYFKVLASAIVTTTLQPALTVPFRGVASALGNASASASYVCNPILSALVSGAAKAVAKGSFPFLAATGQASVRSQDNLTGAVTFQGFRTGLAVKARGYHFVNAAFQSASSIIAKARATLSLPATIHARGLVQNAGRAIAAGALAIVHGAGGHIALSAFQTPSGTAGMKSSGNLAAHGKSALTGVARLLSQAESKLSSQTAFASTLRLMSRGVVGLASASHQLRVNMLLRLNTDVAVAAKARITQVMRLAGNIATGSAANSKLTGSVGIHAFGAVKITDAVNPAMLALALRATGDALAKAAGLATIRVLQPLFTRTAVAMRSAGAIAGKTSLRALSAAQATTKVLEATPIIALYVKTVVASAAKNAGVFAGHLSVSGLATTKAALKSPAMVMTLNAYATTAAAARARAAGLLALGAKVKTSSTAASRLTGRISVAAATAVGAAADLTQAVLVRYAAVMARSIITLRGSLSQYTGNAAIATKAAVSAMMGIGQKPTEVAGIPVTNISTVGFPPAKPVDDGDDMPGSGGAIDVSNQ